jgi:CheY-like chemotaxis protein
MATFPPTVLIVVVDDEVLERMGASYMFADAGFRVLEAASAAMALRLFEADPDIRLLFSDVSMPGAMNGADLARQVAVSWPKVGIILTSGRPCPDRIPSKVRFHAKPYDPADVLRDAGEMAMTSG